MRGKNTNKLRIIEYNLKNTQIEMSVLKILQVSAFKLKIKYINKST